MERRSNKQQHLLTTAATSSKHSSKQVIARVISRGGRKKKKTSTINKHTTNNTKQHNNNNRRNYKRTVIKKATPSIKFLKYKYKYRQPKHYYHNYSYKLIVHMRGHRPTTRGSGSGSSGSGSGTNNNNTRRRRTLSGGRPLPQTIQNLETIVESPATLNPNTAEWWRRRTSIDSSDHDGDRTVSTISTADTRKRFAPSAAHNQAHEHEGLEVPTKIPFDVDDDDVDDGDTINSQDVDLVQQTIMVVHSIPSKIPDREPRTPPTPEKKKKSASSSSSSDSGGMRRSSSDPNLFDGGSSPSDYKTPLASNVSKSGTMPLVLSSPQDHQSKKGPTPKRRASIGNNLSSLGGGSSSTPSPRGRDQSKGLIRRRRASMDAMSVSSPKSPRNKSPSSGGPTRRPSISEKSVNSITFLPDKDGSDSYSSEDGSQDDYSQDGMEVMDLRPSSSIVSFSEFSMDEELASGLFPTSGGAGGALASGRSSSDLLPIHWNAASSSANSSSGKANDGFTESQAQAAAIRASMRAREHGGGGDGGVIVDTTDAESSGGRLTGRRWSSQGGEEGEEAFRALMSLMGHPFGGRHSSASQASPNTRGGDSAAGDRSGRGGDGRSSSPSYNFHPGLANFHNTSSGGGGGGGRASMMSVASASSGYWSAMGDLTADDGSNSEASTQVSENTSLGKRKRKHELRQLYVRRCARAMVTVVALAALSCTALYFITNDGGQSFRDSIPFFGNTLDSASHTRDLERGGSQDDARLPSLSIGSDEVNMEIGNDSINAGAKAGRGIEGETQEDRETRLQLREERKKARQEQRIAARQKQAEIENAISGAQARAAADNAANNRRASIAGQEEGYDYYAGQEWAQQDLAGYENDYPFSSSHQTSNHPSLRGGLAYPQDQAQQDGQRYDFYAQNEWQQQQYVHAGQDLDHYANDGGSAAHSNMFTIMSQQQQQEHRQLEQQANGGFAGQYYNDQQQGQVFDYQLQDEWQGRQLSAANDQQVEQALQDQGYNNAAVPQAYDTYNDA